MAIIIRSDNVNILYARMISQLRQNRIPTWLLDEDDDITISEHRWRYHAWMRIYPPAPNDAELQIGIISSQQYRMTKELYGVYHGRLCATLLAYYDYIMSAVETTPMPIKNIDLIFPFIQTDNI